MTSGEPRLLILETSGRAGKVALAEGRHLLAARRLDESRRHARDLAPAVAELLAQAGWKPTDVHAVVVGRGPGSYTGLRVGIMSAKTFAYATACRILAVDTFAAIALQTPAEIPLVDVMADAQQENIYLQSYRRGETRMEPISTLAIVRLGDWLRQRDPRVWVSGPGVGVYGDRIPSDIARVGAEFWDPRPQSILELGLERLLRGECDNPFFVEPLYLRPSAAEEQLQTRTKKAPK